MTSPDAAIAPTSMQDELEPVLVRYRTLKDHKTRLQDELKEQLKPINEELASLEAGLLHLLNTLGVNKLSTKHGTPFKKTFTHVKVEDKEVLQQFVIGNQYWHMLDWKPLSSAVKELHEEDIHIPGITVNTTQVCQVNFAKARTT